MSGRNDLPFDTNGRASVQLVPQEAIGLGRFNSQLVDNGQRETQARPTVWL
jgi:hypothetical protein